MLDGFKYLRYRYRGWIGEWCPHAALPPVAIGPRVSARYRPTRLGPVGGAPKGFGHYLLTSRVRPLAPVQAGVPEYCRVTPSVAAEEVTLRL